MSDQVIVKPRRGALFWTGWVFTVLPALALLFSAFMKIQRPLPPEAAEGMAKMGLTEDRLNPLAVVETVCTVLYLIPPTAVLGAVLLTGYLGGAVATHVLGNDVQSIAAPIILGVIMWLGLFFRDPRVRALIPWRK